MFSKGLIFWLMIFSCYTGVVVKQNGKLTFVAQMPTSVSFKSCMYISIPQNISKNFSNLKEKKKKELLLLKFFSKS